MQCTKKTSKSIVQHKIIAKEALRTALAETEGILKNYYYRVQAVKHPCHRHFNFLNFERVAVLTSQFTVSDFKMWLLAVQKNSDANSSETDRNPILLIGYFVSLRILFCLYIKGRFPTIKSLAFARNPTSTNCLQQLTKETVLVFRTSFAL